MTDTTETPTLDHADDSILESWNAIRSGDDGAATNDGATQETAAVEAPDDAKPAVPARDATGKFAKVAPATANEAFDQIDADKAAQVEQIAASGHEQAAAPAVAGIESPKSMPKDLADKHWSGMSPEVQAWVHKRDQDYEAGIGRYRDRAASFDRVEAALAPYQQTLERLGAQPEQAISQLMGIDHMLRYGQPAEKAAMLVQIANQFGVPLEHLGQVNPLHQQMLAQAQKVHGYESQQASAERTQAQRNLDALTSEVVKFSEGKEHFGAVEQEMLALLPQVTAQNPNASAQEKLQRAYDIAIYANPKTRAALEAQQREAQQQQLRQKAVEAKKAAATNRTPRGSVATTAAVGSMEDTIRAKAAELGMA